MLQIATMLDDVYGIDCKADNMLVLGASSKAKVCKCKVSSHIIVPEFRVDGTKGRRRLKAITNNRKRDQRMSQHFDTSIYHKNRTRRSALSGKHTDI